MSFIHISRKKVQKRREKGGGAWDKIERETEREEGGLQFNRVQGISTALGAVH